MSHQHDVPRTRTEKDPLGSLEVPASAYYGVQTARAIRNFPISGRLPDPALVAAAVQVKKAAARANQRHRSAPRTSWPAAIIQAADEILGLRTGLRHRRAGEALRADPDRQLPRRPVPGRCRRVSHNMNTNEVLANRAIEILGARGIGSGQRGDYSVVNPNDHVNMAQSTNDTFPTAMRVATLTGCATSCRSLDELAAAFAERAQAFDGVLKSGRTHMQDAVPIRLGQEFAAYALTVRRARGRDPPGGRGLLEQNIGATAVGTGLNAEPEYIELVIKYLSEQTGYRAAHRRTARPGDPVDGADAGRVGVAARPRRRPGQDHGGPAADVLRPADRLRGDPAAGAGSRARRSCPARSTR